MTWKRFHMILCVFMAVVAILRVVTGNIIGAIIPAFLALVFGSIAFDYPIFSRLRRVWKLLSWRRKKD